MSEHLRALVVILALATVVFVLAKEPARALFPAGDFERRRNLWIGITLAAFLAHNFWLFILLAGVLLLIASSRDENKVGLVLFVLLAVPLMRVEVPGFGGIRYFFDMDYFRLIALVLLLPVFIQEMTKHSWRHFSGEVADRLLYSYLVLNVILIFLASTVTGTLRSAFLFFIDVFLPYAIASRLSQNTPSLRSAIASYVIGAAITAGVGVVEFSKSWLLYSSLDDALGLSWDFGGYLRRDEYLRAMGTAGQAIPFGYTMAIGFLLMLGLRRIIRQKAIWLGGLGLLALGMIASYSRGPWLGALAGFLVFALTGPEKKRNTALLVLAGFVLACALIASPIGEKLFDAVTVESGSFDYRKRLLEVAIGVILENPFFGAFSAVYSPAMQELKQGQGIIDIVNTYLAVALKSGIVGLSLFVGFFLAAAFGVWRRVNSVGSRNGEVIDIGRGLLATLACILVTIFTVSSITFIPVIYYLVAGLAVGYARSGRTKPEWSSPEQRLDSPSGKVRYRVAAVSR